MGKARRDAIDAEVARVWRSLVAAQEAFAKSDPRGKYLQAGRSDRPNERLAHRAGLPTWAELNLAGVLGYGRDRLDGVWFVDEYDGPQGKGFVFRCELVDDDGTWTRSWQHGPEPRMALAWSRIA